MMLVVMSSKRTATRLFLLSVAKNPDVFVMIEEKIKQLCAAV